MWAKIVDGFRCDVASLVPIEFWNRARKEVAEVNPDCLWLAESVEYGLIKYARDTGFNCLSDSELYQAFDILYDYDVYPKYLAYVDGEIPLSKYINALNQQEYIYPENYIKLRCLENHDRARAKKLVVTEQEVINYTAFMYMLRVQFCFMQVRKQKIPIHRAFLITIRSIGTQALTLHQFCITFIV